MHTNTDGIFRALSPFLIQILEFFFSNTKTHSQFGTFLWLDRKKFHSKHSCEYVYEYKLISPIHFIEFVFIRFCNNFQSNAKDAKLKLDWVLIITSRCKNKVFKFWTKNYRNFNILNTAQKKKEKKNTKHNDNISVNHLVNV